MVLAGAYFEESAHAQGVQVGEQGGQFRRRLKAALGPGTTPAVGGCIDLTGPCNGDILTSGKIAWRCDGYGCRIWTEYHDISECEYLKDGGGVGLEGNRS